MNAASQRFLMRMNKVGALVYNEAIFIQNMQMMNNNVGRFSVLLLLWQLKTLNLSFPQAKRVGNPSLRPKKDSGQAGMTASKTFTYLIAGVIIGKTLS